MRIGIITQSYYPIHGGVAQHAHHEALELRKRGHEVTVVTSYFNRGDELYTPDWVERIGMDVTMPFNGAFINVTVGRHLAADLQRIQRERQFDVVHIHQPLDPLLGLIAIRALDVPKVVTFHTYRDHVYPYVWFHEQLERDYLARIAVKICVSDVAKSLIAKYFPGEYEVIPNGVDPGRFHPGVEHIAKYDDDVFTILFVGRMDPRKGLRHLLHAYARFKPAHPKSRLVIVGGGILQSYYRRFVQPAGLTDVHFEGYATPEQLPRYYATADCYVSPVTAGESFGIVLIEAMASGCPVIGSDVGGYRFVIDHERNGLLVPPKNPDALAAALAHLADDTAFRARLGRQALADSVQYHWSSVVDRIEACLVRATHRGT